MSDHPTINLALYAQTDVGMVRSGNEDNFLILDLSSGKSWSANEEEPHELLTYAQGYYGTLLAVSDGMGGALAGEVASRIAVETVRDRMLQLQAHDAYKQVPFAERLRLAVEEANSIIHTDGQTNQSHRGLGATFTAVAANGTDLYFAQVGDSRAHLIRRGKIYRVTKDQSLVQQLIDAGQITEEEAETHSYRNVILQALGAHNNVNVEVNSVPLCQLDTLVLCSDGLSGKMHADEIARIVHEASDFKSACQSLISLANERGGEDNITVVVAQFSGDGLPVPDGESLEPKSLARSPDTPTEINWDAEAGAGSTDPFPDPSPNPSGGEIRKTEPLPAAPKQSTPFTSPLPRQSADRKRTNDLSDRVGPITSVFAVEDLTADLSEDSSDKSRVTAEQKPFQPTEPLDPRLTKPLSAAAADLRGETNSSNKNDVLRSEKKSSKVNLSIFIGLVLLGIAGLVITATSYRQETAAKEQRQVESDREQEDLKKQKQGRIEHLKNEINRLNIKLESASKPPANIEAWRKQLVDFNNQLSNLNSSSLEDTTKVCREIEKQVKEIEANFDTTQGLLRMHPTNRDPVKV